MPKNGRIAGKRVFAPVTWIIDYVITKRRKLKIKKTNIAGIKPPYLILCTHTSVLDYSVTSMVTFPNRVYNVCDKSDFMDHNILMNTRNCIYEHKFTKNPELIKDVKKVLRKGGIVALYPETRYSADGTNSEISPNLYKIIRMLKVPVVILKIHGSYICESCWNKKIKKNKLEAEMISIINQEEIKKITIEQIKEKIEKEFSYNEYRWQKNNRLKISFKERCDGLEHILYKCPSCMEECKMISKNDMIYCGSCGKEWKLTEYGKLKAVMEYTEYTSIADWYAFQKNKLNDEIITGEYNFYSEIRIEHLKKNNTFEIVDEEGEMWHNEDGMMLFFKEDAKDRYIEKPAEEMYSCHIEYNHKNKGECIEIIDNDEIYYIYPLAEKFSVMKFVLAVEIIYNIKQETKNIYKKRKKKRTTTKAVTVDVSELMENEEQIEQDNKGAVIAIEFRDDEVTEEKLEEIKKTAHTVNVIKSKSD